MTDEREEALADQGDMERKEAREGAYISARTLGNAPRYLVQPDLTGALYAYWDPLLVRCDVALHRGIKVTVFKATTELGRLSYHPITVDELKEEK